MRFFAYALLGTLAIFSTAAGASAALNATLDEGSDGRSWRLIAVEFPPTNSDVEITAQDTRGGPQFVRRVPGNSGRTWLPLPLEAPAQLTGPVGGKWYVKVTLRAKGRILEETRSEFALPIGAHALPHIISAVPLSTGEATCTQLPPQEIIGGPALLFAAFDIIYLTPELQSQISESRALEMLSVGARLVVANAGTAGPPASASLSRLLWQRIKLPGIGAAWVTAAPPLPRPAVVESGLAALPQVVAHPLPAQIIWGVVGVVPGGMVLLVIAVGLFLRRRRAALLAALGLVVVLSGGVILYLRGQSLQGSTVAEWGENGLEERVERVESLFGATLNRWGNADETVLPVAETASGYWKLGTIEVYLGGEMRLIGSMPARSGVYLETRTARLGGVLPAYPRTAEDRARLWQALHLDPKEAHWLIEGYVKPTDQPEDPGELLSTWAAANPGPSGSGVREAGGMPTMAWYNLRFQAAHRYVVFFRDGIPNFLDFGSAVNSAQESTPLP
jgi:hypothetical protein